MICEERSQPISVFPGERGQTLVALPNKESGGRRVDKTRLIVSRARNTVDY